MRSVMALPCLVFACYAVVAIAGDEPSDTRSRAIALYDAADYRAALPLLEQLAAGGEADGPLLYRLAFARTQNGDAAGGSEAQARALETLEREHDAGGGLEVTFYLSNAYRNVRRPQDSRVVAAAATARIESGELDAGDDALSAFRVGKLYEDQGRFDDAAPWYERAIEGMSDAPERYLGYLRWSLRMLGRLAYSREDFAEAERRFTMLTDHDPSSPDDWDALAVARARQGRWEPAEQAWVAAEQLNPADANRARYCYRIARLAKEIGDLPEALPDGRTIASLTRQDLEAVLEEISSSVRTIRDEAAREAPLTGERRRELQERLDDARAVFVAAASEYALRRLPIRETAFFGGYAPLIFKRGEWSLPGGS